MTLYNLVAVFDQANLACSTSKFHFDALVQVKFSKCTVVEIWPQPNCNWYLSVNKLNESNVKSENNETVKCETLNFNPGGEDLGIDQLPWQLIAVLVLLLVLYAVATILVQGVLPVGS